MIDQHYIDIFEKFLRNEISEEEIEELQAIMYINKDIYNVILKTGLPKPNMLFILICNRKYFARLYRISSKK